MLPSAVLITIRIEDFPVIILVAVVFPIALSQNRRVQVGNHSPTARRAVDLGTRLNFNHLRPPPQLLWHARLVLLRKPPRSIACISGMLQAMKYRVHFIITCVLSQNPLQPKPAHIILIGTHSSTLLISWFSAGASFLDLFSLPFKTKSSACPGKISLKSSICFWNL